nr:hypothetical protein [uncultured Glaciecola sp.]
MQIRLISSLCIAAIVLIFTGFLFESASSFTLYVILLGILLIPARGVRIELSLLYNIGILAVLFFYWYWGEFYGSHYFIGGFSDDWQYDVLWSEGYHQSYGINPFYLSEHLGILHNSKGYVYLVVLMREFGSTIDGYHTLLPRFLNIFFLGMTSLVSYNITLHFLKINDRPK